MASFEYTYRCPGCRREVHSHTILVQRHTWCPETKRKDGEGLHMLVLVAVDGESVALAGDPQPVSSDVSSTLKMARAK